MLMRHAARTIVLVMGSSFFTGRKYQDYLAAKKHKRRKRASEKTGRFSINSSILCFLYPARCDQQEKKSLLYRVQPISCSHSSSFLRLLCIFAAKKELADRLTSRRPRSRDASCCRLTRCMRPDRATRPW